MTFSPADTVGNFCAGIFTALDYNLSLQHPLYSCSFSLPSCSSSATRYMRCKLQTSPWLLTNRNISLRDCRCTVTNMCKNAYYATNLMLQRLTIFQMLHLIFHLQFQKCKLATKQAGHLETDSLNPWMLKWVWTKNFDIKHMMLPVGKQWNTSHTHTEWYTIPKLK
jgi:hypothetical protein